MNKINFVSPEAEANFNDILKVFGIDDNDMIDIWNSILEDRENTNTEE